MVATVAFVLAFLFIGLSVVFVAMRSRAGGGESEPSRAARRVTWSSIALVCAVFGLAVPAVIMIGNNTARSDNGPGGVELNSAQKNGRRLFAHNCATCHTLVGAGASGRVGPNLDNLHPPVQLTLDAIAHGRANGQGQMPSGLLAGNEAKDVASFIAAVAGR